jgi:hypothetical protein
MTAEEGNLGTFVLLAARALRAESFSANTT